MFCFQIFRKWHVLPSLDLSILLENMNCSRKICELYEKKWIVPEKKFSGTIHIFSYNWQIFLEQFIFSDKIDRSRGGTTCYFLQKFIIYYRPVYTSIIQQIQYHYEYQLSTFIIILPIFLLVGQLCMNGIRNSYQGNDYCCSKSCGKCEGK